MIETPTSAPLHRFYLAVGGQARKVGKTALVVDIVNAFPDRNWTAVKITSYTESGCPLNGPSCDCAADQHLYAIHNETQHEGKTDSSRFLAAGASRALWLQTKEGRLEAALPALAEELKTTHTNPGARAPHLIIESDALVRFWNPSLFLMVLDPANPDFKSSALENLARADAFVLRSPQGAFIRFSPYDSPDQSAKALLNPLPAPIKLPGNTPRFLHPISAPMPQNLRHFLAGSISA